MFRPRASLAQLTALTLICVGLALSGVSTASAEPAGPTADIINGTAVPDDPSNWPYIAGLLASSSGLSQFCGGTVIAPSWVLTAAHCIDPFGPPAPTHVLIGRKLLSGTGGETIAVAAKFVHPGYDGEASHGNDIALLKLGTPSAATPAPMAGVADDPPAAASVAVAGWGNTSQTSDDFPDELRETTVEVVSNAACGIAYGGTVPSSMLCAAHFEGVNDSLSRDTCQGDSGGPLIYNGKLAGVTSFGVGCAESPFPGVYTRVSSFSSWIASTMSGVDPLLSATSLDFGNVTVDGSHSLRTVTLTAGGTGELDVPSVGSSSSEFLVTSDQCTGTVLSVGESCNVQIAFKPLATGVRGGFLSFSTNGGTKKVNLFGTGVAAGQPSSAVGLTVKQSRRAKRSGKKITAIILVSFPIDTRLDNANACLGGVRLSVKPPKMRRVTRSGGVIWANGECRATFLMRLPLKAKRKTAAITATFAGNARFAPATLTTKLKIK